MDIFPGQTTELLMAFYHRQSEARVLKGSLSIHL